MSSLRTLDGLGALPKVLRSAAEGSPQPLDWLSLKQAQSRFAVAGGSGVRASGAFNVGIGADPERDENEPTVAANPRSERRLVAGSHSFDPVTQVNHCVAYRSRDAGGRWSAPVTLKQLTAGSFCSDPVLAYAPDGKHVYYAYMDIKVSESVTGDPENPDTITLSSDLDVLVSRSGNDGETWSDPAVALDGDPSSVTFDPASGEMLDQDPGSDYDKPWIATHVARKRERAANAQHVYVSATRFDTFNPGFACAIVVTQSSRRGKLWSRGTELDSSGADCGAPVLVQGSRPSGGPRDDAIVAWYHSGDDGAFQGAFEIRTAVSMHGRRWSSPVTATRDSFETPFYLGPFAFYHRWSGTMFPDVEIAPDGRVHIVYTHDPEENGFTVVDPDTGEEFFLPDVSTTAEDGDIRYITSRGRPYDAWSTPITLNDDGLVRAQGYPALETGQDRRGRPILHVLWMDHRLSPEGPTDPDRFGESSNRYYDIFSTSRRGARWTPNRRVTDKRSISDFIFVGDYNDITTAGDDVVFGIWTDRRHQTSTGASVDAAGNVVIDEPALEDNVFGTPVSK